jgi:hypothetical protein
MECDEDIVDMFVPAGTLCFHVNEAGPNLICINGEWVEAISGIFFQFCLRYSEGRYALKLLL